jgi:hypothetical protein
MAPESNDRFKASFSRPLYAIPMSMCTAVVWPTRRSRRLSLVAKGALNTQGTKDAVAVDNCVDMHINQQSIRAHANKVLCGFSVNDSHCMPYMAAAARLMENEEIKHKELRGICTCAHHMHLYHCATTAAWNVCCDAPSLRILFDCAQLQERAAETRAGTAQEAAFTLRFPALLSPQHFPRLLAALRRVVCVGIRFVF